MIVIYLVKHLRIRLVITGQTRLLPHIKGLHLKHLELVHNVISFKFIFRGGLHHFEASAQIVFSLWEHGVEQRRDIEYIGCVDRVAMQAEQVLDV